MVIKKKLSFFGVLFFAFSAFFATCKKSECINNAYVLKETWNVLPQKDSINVGDTLMFNSQFSNHPFDYNSNKSVYFSGDALIGTPFDLRIIKGLNNLQPAIDSFNFFIIAGSMKPNDNVPHQIRDLQWVENNGIYQIQFGLIAQKKGDYVFTLPDAIGKLKKAKECEDGASIILTNSNLKNNAYLLRPYYSYPNVPSDDSAHVFCIRVK